MRLIDLSQIPQSTAVVIQNRKNEIEWGTFMAVIRYIDGKYNTNNSNINNNNKTSTILS